MQLVACYFKYMQLTKKQHRWATALIVVSTLALVLSSIAYSLLYALVP